MARRKFSPGPPIRSMHELVVIMERGGNVVWDHKTQNSAFMRGMPYKALHRAVRQQRLRYALPLDGAQNGKG